MVNGPVYFLLNPRNFGGQSLQPFLQLFNRKRIEILLQQQGERVGRPPGKEFVQIHRQKVDLLGGGVNMVWKRGE
jgi:hypothetical protein